MFLSACDVSGRARTEGLGSFRKRLMTDVLIESAPFDTSSAQTQLEQNIDSHIAKVTDEKV